MESLRQNTARIQFQKANPKPNDQEMMRFVLNIGLTTKDVHTLYQDLYERCIYIKFNNEPKYQEFIMENKVFTFTYTNGIETEVTVKATSGIMRYVRVFNLPPEITDRTLNEAMQRFGNIISIRREKYGANSLMPVFSGVRGVCIELERDMPQFMYINNIKARLYYDGMREKCFKCGDESHKKQDCPLLCDEIPTQESIQQSTSQPQEAQGNRIQHKTQLDAETRQQSSTNEQNITQTASAHQRATYSDITKITQQQVEAQNKIDNIKKMINLKEHVKERKLESESSCMDTENEEMPVNTNNNKRGRPPKKTRYTSTKTRIAITDHIKNITSDTSMNDTNFIAPQTPFISDTVELE